MPDRLTIHHAPSPGTHHARAPYVERYWLPTLGPSAVALLRRLALDAETRGAARFTSYDLEDLAACIGLGPHTTQVTRVLDRLARFDLAGQISTGAWYVATTLPPVDPKHYRRLPATLRLELEHRAGTCARCGTETDETFHDDGLNVYDLCEGCYCDAKAARLHIDAQGATRA